MYHHRPYIYLLGEWSVPARDNFLAFALAVFRSNHIGNYNWSWIVSASCIRTSQASQIVLNIPLRLMTLSDSDPKGNCLFDLGDLVFNTNLETLALIPHAPLPYLPIIALLLALKICHIIVVRWDYI